MPMDRLIQAYEELAKRCYVLEQENARLKGQLQEAMEIRGIHRQMVRDVSLSEDAEKILHDNLWELYGD
jgi:phosphoenolpyruvate-protein kinase (PTS system EI component)